MKKSGCGKEGTDGRFPWYSGSECGAVSALTECGAVRGLNGRRGVVVFGDALECLLEPI